MGKYFYLLYCPTKYLLKNCITGDSVISIETFLSFFLSFLVSFGKILDFKWYRVQSRIHLSDFFCGPRLPVKNAFIWTLFSDTGDSGTSLSLFPDV